MMKQEGAELGVLLLPFGWRCAHPQSVKEMREDTAGVLKLKTEQTKR